MKDRIEVVRAALDLTPRQFAKALGVSPATVQRWIDGENEPTGLHEEVINGLYYVVRGTPIAVQISEIRAMLMLGVGSMIAALLEEHIR